jgi:hypothetical protein
MRNTGTARGKRVAGVLEMGPLEHTVCLFTSEVALDQTLGNLYHFIKSNHHIKNLLTVKQLLNVVSYFIVTVLKNALYRVGQGA